MLKIFFSKFYSYWICKKLSGLWLKDTIFFSREPFSVKIIKAKTSKVTLNGKINFRSHLGSLEPIRIILEDNATLTIDGDIEIGAGSVILVRENASLRFGGRKNLSTSGMASNCKILVRSHINIGHDVIIAWNVVITDSDWHPIKGVEPHNPVIIEDKVWLSHNVSVLKGVTIQTESLIAAHSLVVDSIPSKTLAGGVPAKIIREDVQWGL